MRALDVYLGRDFIGQLVDSSGIWGFQYTRGWVLGNGSLAIIPGIEVTEQLQLDKSTTRPVQWFFDNLLPEETARELLAKSEKIPPGDAFALLAAIGHESAGAFTLLPPGTLLEAGDATPISHIDLNARIKKLPKSPLNNLQRKKMSLAGAQHKMLVIFTDDGQLLEPSGQMPSTHILKPEHSRPDEYPFTCRNEWFVMSLARRCGMPVPDVDIIYVPEPAYIVRRFDRVGEYPEQSRLHVLDGCQLLELPFGDKYKASSAENLLKLCNRCLQVAMTKIAIFRWALFNAIVGNGDAHLKNLSFHLTTNGIHFMPHYDLLSTTIYAATGQHSDEELSQPMGKAKRYGELTRDDVIAFASEIQIAPALAERELNKLLASIPVHADVLFEQVCSLGDYSHSRPGEIRMLRQIRSLCIDEMVKQLR